MKTLQDPESLEELCDRLRTVSLHSARLWGTMTPHQMICHLNDSLKMGIGERITGMRTSPLSRTVVKWIALYAPMQWPQGIRTIPEVDQQAGGTKPIAFERDRDELLETMARFARADRTFQWGTHPIFGRMSAAEWLRWGYIHTDHHLRQFGA
jgi:hypothetical protein